MAPRAAAFAPRPARPEPFSTKRSALPKAGLSKAALRASVAMPARRGGELGRQRFGREEVAAVPPAAMTMGRADRTPHRSSSSPRESGARQRQQDAHADRDRQHGRPAVADEGRVMP
jgi:hypothetical protein